MIGKLSKGEGFRGLAEYLLASRDHEGRNRPEAVIVGGTIAADGNNPARDLARQYAAFRRLRPEVARPVLHESLRLSKGESLTHEQWAEVGKMWAAGMGADGYTVIAHGDHCHVMASRIKLDGSLVSTWQDYRVSERLVRDIEQRFGLMQVEASHLLEPEKAMTHKRAPTKGQMKQVERGGEAPALIVSELIDRRLTAGPCGVVDLVEHLEAHGVNVQPNLASTGKLNGLAYEIDGKVVTAKAMGKAYTWGNLEKRGVSYEQHRDVEGLRQRVYRAAQGGLGSDRPGDGRDAGADRAAAPDARSVLGERGSPDRAAGRGDQRLAGEDNGLAGGGGGDAGAPGRTAGDGAGASLGGTQRSVVDEQGRVGGHRDAPPRPDQGSDGRAGTAAGRAEENGRPAGGRDGGGDAAARRGGGDDRAAGRAVVAPVGGLHGGGDSGRGSYGRVMDLVDFPTSPAPGGPGAGRTDLSSVQVDAVGRDAGTGVSEGIGGRQGSGQPGDGLEVADRTRRAIERTLRALPAATYEIGVRNQKTGQMMRRCWTADQVRQSVPWLKRRNVLGDDIYMRPEDTRFVMLDDLTAAKLDEMRAKGYQPALVTETSKGNFQAWVMLPQSLAEDARSFAGKALARKFEADPASTDWRHFGRLPGFTNQKPERRNERKMQPFVLVAEAAGHICGMGQQLVEWVEEQVARAKAEVARARGEAEERRRLVAIETAPQPAPGRLGVGYQFLHLARQQVDQGKAAGRPIDWSNVDFAVAKILAGAGHQAGEIEAAIIEHSPN
ncbi:MAG: relaxase/mobilization nuclease domain-containing protein, partial [Alphaproteobacteria bacterium]|nr:relaxase/mobilization nuclease domain-containing protein [Alphaproteobacteria bacterium]